MIRGQLNDNERLASLSILHPQTCASAGRARESLWFRTSGNAKPYDSTVFHLTKPSEDRIMTLQASLAADQEAETPNIFGKEEAT
jgi:hypothetical protein